MYKRVLSNLRFLGVVGSFNKVLLQFIWRRRSGAPNYLEFSSNHLFMASSLEELLSKIDANALLCLPEAKSWHSSWTERIVTQNLKNRMWNAERELQLLLFCIVRAQRPSLVVETGSSHGASAAAIAEALSRNQSGHLISFDIADAQMELVSDRLADFVSFYKIRSRQDIVKTIKDSQNRLVENGPCIFLHDSNHSYHHQLMEYKLARKLKFDILVSDDVDASAAFAGLDKFSKFVLRDSHKYIGITNMKSQISSSSK